MKLFLNSKHFSREATDELLKSLGGKSARTLILTTAAVPYGLENKPEWLTDSIDEITELSESVEELTLEPDTKFP